MVLTKALLEKHYYDGKAIERMDDRLDEISSRVIPSEHGVVMGSMKDFPYKQCHFVISGSNVVDDEEYKTRVRQLFVTLIQKKKEYEQDEKDILQAINEIEDERTRYIVHEKYIQHRTDADISKELGVARTTITMILSKVIK